MISAALPRRAARTVSEPPPAAPPYQSRTALMLCGAAIFALALHPALSQTTNGAVQSVEVRGSEFIPAQDIQMTCGAEVGVAYSDYELRAIEDCLMSTGAFESVALTREGAGLVITVQELDTRPPVGWKPPSPMSRKRAWSRACRLSAITCFQRLTARWRLSLTTRSAAFLPRSIGESSSGSCGSRV